MKELYKSSITKFDNEILNLEKSGINVINFISRTAGYYNRRNLL